MLIKRAFQQYYKSAQLVLPPRFGLREWGFFYFGGQGMQRHLKFSKSQHLQQYLVNRVPSHVYYSAAYYQAPDDRSMLDKKWKGADLIFDLDADHLKNAEDMSFQQQMENVKLMLIYLIDEFLVQDFGFDTDKMDICFSGGRGYHIHIYDPEILNLESRHRREIVDYITGLGIKTDNFLIKEIVGTTSYKNHVKPNISVELYPVNTPGWYGRITRGVHKILNQLQQQPKDEVIKKISSIEGIGKKGATNIYSKVFEDSHGYTGVDRIIKYGNIEIFPTDSMRDKFLKFIIEEVRVNVAGETDEPVTTDIKRLIRLPTSLHGKTGFKVVPVKYDHLRDFNPLLDAVVLPDETVNFHAHKYYEIKMKNETIKIVPGQNEIPLFSAVFMTGQKIGEIKTGVD